MLRVPDALANDLSLMTDLVRNWAAVNSGTDNIAGVRHVAQMAGDWLAEIAQSVMFVELPPRQTVTGKGDLVPHAVGPAVLAMSRPTAPVRVLLVGHTDTVFHADHPFQEVRRQGERLLGPGVADMKGGLVTMLFALRHLERHHRKMGIGWTVLLTPDEEVGSPSSISLLQEHAKNHHFGLVYEPTLPGGVLVSSRGGSTNYNLVLRGKSSHVGRNPGDGRSALHAAAGLVADMTSLNQSPEAGVTVNVGRIDGGGPVNIVSDLAIVRFNVRAKTVEAQNDFEKELRGRLDKLERDGISHTLHSNGQNPPKAADARTTALQEAINATGAGIGMDLKWGETGGVCDGNKLAAAGLANIDTMGVVGGGLHSDEEYMLTHSLMERTLLSYRLLVGFATGEHKLNAALPG